MYYSSTKTMEITTVSSDIVSDRIPSNYIADLIKQNGGGENELNKVKGLFNDHCIGEAYFNYLKKDDYIRSIEERRKDVKRELITTGKVPQLLESGIEEDVDEMND